MKLNVRTRARRKRSASALPRDWVESLPTRSQRVRRRLNGRLIPVKRPDARKRGPSRVAIVTGLDAKAVRGELDQRFGFAKAVSTYTREYQEQLGDRRSIAQDDYCRSAGTAKAIRNLALARLMNSGPFDNADEARAAYENYRRADADLRDVLRHIGLERREKPVPDLAAYLAGKRKHHVEEEG